MNVQLISTTKFESEEGFAESLERIARHGKSSEREKGRLLKYLWTHKHLSPFEFVDFCFKIETSRAVSAQLFRHQANRQEWSQRYSKTISWEPIEFRLEHEKNHQSSTERIGEITKSFIYQEDGISTEQGLAINNARTALQLIEEAYEDLIRVGVAKETARFLLPMASTTVVHMKFTLRNLLTFLNSRLDHHTQKECRLVAVKMAEILADQMPEVAEMTNNFNEYKGMFL